MELELIHHQPKKVKFQHPLLFLQGAYSGGVVLGSAFSGILQFHRV